MSFTVTISPKDYGVHNENTYTITSEEPLSQDTIKTVMEAWTNAQLSMEQAHTRIAKFDEYCLKKGLVADLSKVLKEGESANFLSFVDNLHSTRRDLNNTLREHKVVSIETVDKYKKIWF